MNVKVIDVMKFPYRFFFLTPHPPSSFNSIAFLNVFIQSSFEMFSIWTQHRKYTWTNRKPTQYFPNWILYSRLINLIIMRCLAFIVRFPKKKNRFWILPLMLKLQVLDAGGHGKNKRWIIYCCCHFYGHKT